MKSCASTPTTPTRDARTSSSRARGHGSSATPFLDGRDAGHPAEAREPDRSAKARPRPHDPSRPVREPGNRGASALAPPPRPLRACRAARASHDDRSGGGRSSEAGARVARPAARLTRLARPSIATVRLDENDDRKLRARLEWTEPTPAATLARRVALELAEIDIARLKRGECAACNLVFYDTTRSGTRRWHAESPCGNRERQRRHRAASRLMRAPRLPR